MKTGKLIFLLLAFMFFKANAQTQYIKGLTVMVEFTDAPFPNSIDSVSNMMNQIGFRGWGNEGSVREYYLAQTAGKIDLSSTVIKVSLAHDVNYYYGPNAPGHDLSDILDAVNAKYPAGFTGLTMHGDTLTHFHILTRKGGGAWGFGPQVGTNTIKNNGVNAKAYYGSITNYGYNQNPKYSTICHETGHAIFSWGDYYNLNSPLGQIGHYCLMGSGESSSKPMPICAPLRNLKGWINTVNDITNSSTQTFSIQTNDYTQVYKYTNAQNPKEYFLISAHKHGGFWVDADGENFPLDEGLAVWYVDEGRTYGKISPYIKLIQADGVDEMNDNSLDNNAALKVNLRGDVTDLFDNQFPVLNDASNPLLRWKDGSLTGLNLSEISTVNTTMTFKFNKVGSGCAGVPTYCSYPCIYNQGDVVQYNGKKYQSLVNSLYNVTPGTASQWWKDLGTCGTVNAAPVVSLTSPTALSYRAPATVAIAANATDDVAISKVEFYNGTTLLNTDLTAPYSFSWTGVIAGNYSITAKAYDNEGLVTTSPVILIAVNNNMAPVITVTAPLAVNGINPKYLVNGSQTISANVSDDVSVSKVVFTLIKTGATVTDVTAPYSATFTNLPTPNGDGSLGYTITAYDNENLTSTTSVVVYKNKVPSIAISSPAANATLTNNVVTISALVLDADWTSGKVEYFNGATKLGETTNNSALSGAINFTWNNVANGNYTITAKATDDMGESSTSSSIIFIVNKVTSTCTAQAYSATTAYNTGAVVQYNGIRYTANWWTQGEQPDLNNGGTGSGKPWTSNGPCNAKIGDYETATIITSIYPNPTNGTFIIESETEAPAQILNSFGKEVASLLLVKGVNDINVSLTKGIYYVRIYNKMTKLVIE